MYDDINLAIKKKRNTPRKKQVEILKKISFVILFIVAILSIIIFLLNLRFSISSVKKQQKAAMQNLSTYDQTAIKIFLLNSRLNDIGSILGSRVKHNQSVGKVVFDVTGSMRVEELSVNGSSFSITVSSPSLFDLNDFLNNILSLSSSKEVSNVSLKELRIGESGYTMSLEMNLP